MRKSLLALGPVIICLVGFVVPANAHEVTSASATVSCSGYSIEFQYVDLNTTDSYTISWTINGLGPTTVSSSFNFSSSASGNFSNNSGSQSFSTLTGGPFSPSGTATFVDHTTGETNTLSISFSPSGLTCPGPPPPPPCQASATNSSNFNGTSVPAGTYIWFNANFKANGVPSSGVTINFTNGNISFTAGGISHSLAVPKAQITFSPSATCSSTTFDSATDTWITTVPVSGDDEIFLTGLAWPVPSGGLASGANPVNFTGTYSSTTDAPGLSIQMVWSAAAYSTFTTNYNALQVKAGHQTACGQTNGYHAGTPEGVDSTNTPWKDYLVGGPRGGGGSNFTGSWSGTLNIPICPH